MPRHGAGPDDDTPSERQHPALVAFEVVLGIMPTLVAIVILALMVLAVVVTLSRR